MKIKTGIPGDFTASVGTDQNDHKHIGMFGQPNSGDEGNALLKRNSRRPQWPYEKWAFLFLPFVLVGVKDRNEQTLTGEETIRRLTVSADGTRYGTSLSVPKSCSSLMPEI